MNKRWAKRLAYGIASGLLMSDNKAGCVGEAVAGRGGTEEDAEMVEAAVEEICSSLNQHSCTAVEAGLPGHDRNPGEVE